MRPSCGQQGTTYHTAPPRASKKTNTQKTMNATIKIYGATPDTDAEFDLSALTSFNTARGGLSIPFNQFTDAGNALRDAITDAAKQAGLKVRTAFFDARSTLIPWKNEETGACFIVKFARD